VIVVGVDENGLGPILGPLVVTGVAFETPGYDAEAFWRLAGADLPADDSKVIFSAKGRERAERAVLSWLALLGVDTATHRSIVASVSGPLPFPTPCGDPPATCSPATTSLPAWSSAPSPGVSLGAWNRLDEARVRVLAATCRIACVGALNRACEAPGMNKLRVDFELMMSAVAALAAETGQEVLALCGKVGSTLRYGPWLEGLGLEGYAIERERRDESTYLIDGVGRVSFIRDADSAHLPVAVASMIGKYVRELAMERLNATLGADGARRASGYRDPVTARFIAETSAAREAARLPDACFLRST